jgi:hypothetical protein
VASSKNCLAVSGVPASGRKAVPLSRVKDRFEIRARLLQFRENDLVVDTIDRVHAAFHNQNRTMDLADPPPS